MTKRKRIKGQTMIYKTLHVTGELLVFIFTYSYYSAEQRLPVMVS